MWKLLKTAGVSVPRPNTLAAALLLLLMCMLGSQLVTWLIELPAMQQALATDRSTDAGGQDLMNMGLRASALGMLGFLVLGWLWLAAGGTGARLVWWIMMVLGVCVVLSTSGMSLYLGHTVGRDATLGIVLRSLVSLGFFIGSCMLMAPSYALWRDTLRAKDRNVWKRLSAPTPLQ